jgi:hypothetical protein
MASQEQDPVFVAQTREWPEGGINPSDTIQESIKARLRQLQGELRKTAIAIYRDRSTSRDIALGSMRAMVLEAQIEELEWVLSRID